MTRERAQELWNARPPGVPWADSVPALMTPAERDEITALWEAMPNGSSTFMAAFFEVLQGEESKR